MRPWAAWRAPREARKLLSVNDTVSIGGAHDVRRKADLAMRGGVLDAPDLLDIKSTLISARELARTFERQQIEYPQLSRIAERPRAPARPGGYDLAHHFGPRRSARQRFARSWPRSAARSKSPTTA